MLLQLQGCNMSFTKLMDSWKTIIAFTVVVITSVYGVLTWAQEELQQQQILIEAKAALIHDDLYQESRISRKEDEIRENNRELDNLLEYIGEEEPTIREDREIEYLDDEVSRLKKEIEGIRVELAKK
jgi:hypothetical protein